MGIINGEMGYKFKDTSFTFILNYVFVYEKAEDGNWLISRDIYNYFETANDPPNRLADRPDLTHPNNGPPDLQFV